MYSRTESSVLQTLPEEILKLIFHHATRPTSRKSRKNQRTFTFCDDYLPNCSSSRISTSLSLSLVSSWVRRASVEFLLEAVCLVGLAKMEQFQALLLARQDYGIHVKELSLCYYHFEGIDHYDNVVSALQMSNSIIRSCTLLKTLDMHNFVPHIEVRHLRAEAPLFRALWTNIGTEIKTIAVPGWTHIPFLLDEDLEGLSSFVDEHKSLVNWYLPSIEDIHHGAHLEVLLCKAESLCSFWSSVRSSVLPLGLVKLKRLEVKDSVLATFGAIPLPELEDLHYYSMPSDAELTWALTSLPALKSLEYVLRFPGHVQRPWSIFPAISGLRCVTMHVDHRVVAEDHWLDVVASKDATRSVCLQVEQELKERRKQVQAMFSGITASCPLLEQVAVHCGGFDGFEQELDKTRERIVTEAFDFLRNGRCGVSVYTGISQCSIAIRS